MYIINFRAATKKMFKNMDMLRKWNNIKCSIKTTKGRKSKRQSKNEEQ